jgi:hypothetical protein
MPRKNFNSKPKKASQMKLNGRWAMISFMTNFCTMAKKKLNANSTKAFLEKKRKKKLQKSSHFKESTFGKSHAIKRSL